MQSRTLSLAPSSLALCCLCPFSFRPESRRMNPQQAQQPLRCVVQPAGTRLSQSGVAANVTLGDPEHKGR